MGILFILGVGFVIFALFKVYTRNDEPIDVGSQENDYERVLFYDALDREEEKNKDTSSFFDYLDNDNSFFSSDDD
ncbi:hypothetical protein CRU94_03935 [Arcobacter sp. AHV-9/2010]|uniref:hypothetical protein n=1 Tax=Arcobacter sp. AHV-9/2010 TaxID=2021861 RepID=UPI00100B819C|nr:hypothetical protein [Arcobacter sp. CECT 9299]RXJ95773.1 hypothetical protein CRU94_03935 [Arcobacter sp. CECT 9299]